jgi:hypothetical protein
VRLRIGRFQVSSIDVEGEELGLELYMLICNDLSLVSFRSAFVVYVLDLSLLIYRLVVENAGDVVCRFCGAVCGVGV